MAALLAGQKPPTPPASFSSAQGFPADMGMMCNDTLGDCTCAAFYHLRQVWSKLGRGTEVTATDTQVLQLYEEACGYRPDDPTTDQGGVEQDVLAFLVHTGAPVSWGRDKLAAFFEIDVRNKLDVRRAIYECGGIYVGMQMPSNIMAGDGPPAVWDVPSYTGPDVSIEGGHAIAVVGYDDQGLTLVSWGKRYRMTWTFWQTYVDEAYAPIDRVWFGQDGKTFAGLSLTDLETQMAAIKKAAA